MFKAWVEWTLDAALVGLAVQRVVGLRLMKIAAGGQPARAEAQRMVTEKTAALAEATLAAGGSPRTVIRRYRTHVRANERRLSRSKSNQ
jgi:hypothetical protein